MIKFPISNFKFPISKNKFSEGVTRLDRAPDSAQMSESSMSTGGRESRGRTPSKWHAGQTLIEALVALGLAVAIIAAIANIVITSLNNTTYSKNQNLATIHAQEGIETVRKLVNQSYTQFKINYDKKSYCLDENENLFLSSGSCNEVRTGIFIREVKFEHESADCQLNLEAVVKVSWSDNRCRDGSNLYCHNIELSSCFVDINEVQSPL